MSIVTGIALHAVGASAASLCYTPQKKLNHWSWQTYWLAQAFVCWLLLPVIVAWLTIPHLSNVLQEAPQSAKLSSFLLGAAYGIGGTAFGMTIRYIGFSLTYAIAVGISCVLGTLLPSLLQGTLAVQLSKTGAGWIITGLLLGIAGIVFCGISGRMKEKDLSKLENTSLVFNIKKGLPLCILAGILSAFYGLSLNEGEPIAMVAEKYGAGNFRGNAIYLFSNTGAFFSTSLYCVYLHWKNNTGNEYKGLQKKEKSSSLLFNYLLAALTGVMWYSQFFFYGLGHVQLGNFQFTSWGIHMIMLVLFSTLAGILMKEWVTAKSKTRVFLFVAIATLVGAVVLLAYGNYLGGK